MPRISFFLFIIFFLVFSFFFNNFFLNLKSLIPILLGLIIFFMGMTVELNDFIKILKKPKWILLTLFLQFSIMPLLAYLISNFPNISKELGLGFIILGSCPGGTASNVITYLCRGNVSLSLICTLFSTIVAIFITPYLILFLAEKSIEININKLISSTASIILIPLVFGLLMKYIFASVILKIKFIFPIIAEITIALVIAIIFSINIGNFHYLSAMVILGVVLHNLGGLIIGFSLAGFLKIPQAERKTIAIEVGMQNSGLGMALAILHFSKLVAIPAAIFSLWHNISASMLVYLFKKK